MQEVSEEEVDGFEFKSEEEFWEACRNAMMVGDLRPSMLEAGRRERRTGEWRMGFLQDEMGVQLDMRWAARGLLAALRSRLA